MQADGTRRKSINSMRTVFSLSLSLSLSLYEKARAASEDDNLIASGEKTNEKRGRRWN